MSEANINDFINQPQENIFPQEISEYYEPIERLATNQKCETYLAERKSDAELFVIKVSSKDVQKSLRAESEILQELEHEGLPKFIASYEQADRIYVIREYAKGISLEERMREKQFTEEEAIHIGVKLCDILSYLHGRVPPVIHRDIKPSNVIVNGNDVKLIDFDISRKYDENLENDTVYLGTKRYAPPEQFGFSQTDNRTDIYAFGVLLCFLLTGSHDVISLKTGNYNRTLIKTIEKCVAFSPKDRYASTEAVKKALLHSLPKARLRKKVIIFAVILVIAALAVLVVVQYKESKAEEKKSVFPVENPAYVTSAELITDSVAYLNERYQTDLFSESDELINYAYIKSLLINVYGMDAGYVNALPSGDSPPHEDDANFFPWGLGDEESVPREVLMYIVVKTYWPDVVADWSSLTEDTGQYPGARVAINFVKKNGIFDHMNMYGHITKGDAAVVFAAADKVYRKMN